jgi:glyoxylase-like metal-dependent hydrolase (beta-lactamase superfamily II)
MQIKTIFDTATNTLTHIAHDQNTKDAFVVDAVLDFDPQSSTITYDNIDKVDEFIQANRLNLIYIIDTHAHADHLSAAHELKKRYPNAKTAIGREITKVQSTFKSVFNMEDLKTDGSQFDLLLTHGQVLKVGELTLKMISTPGHTPACTSILVDDVLFSGDSLFMPDFGTGRCDFPAGSAQDLYTSIHDKLYCLPDDTRVFVGHDYGTGGREIKWETSIGESKRSNIQLKAETPRDEFVKFRTDRDQTLKEPKLIYQSIQVNVNAGKLPDAESNEISYLKIPLFKR